MHSCRPHPESRGNSSSSHSGTDHPLSSQKSHIRFPQPVCRDGAPSPCAFVLSEPGNPKTYKLKRCLLLAQMLTGSDRHKAAGKALCEGLPSSSVLLRIETIHCPCPTNSSHKFRSAQAAVPGQTLRDAVVHRRCPFQILLSQYTTPRTEKEAAAAKAAASLHVHFGYFSVHASSGSRRP